MTWPFENDTSAIVKKLADRSMKADKRRNAFIIITIAFAVSLMMVLALYNLGTDRENRLYLQGRYQSSFINSTSSTFLLSGKHMNMADCVCWGLHRFRSSVSCEKKVFCYPVLQFLSALYWEVFWAIVSSRTAGIG